MDALWLIDGWMDRWMDRWMDGWMDVNDGWMVGSRWIVDN
jgi:hypothetical protein